MRKYALDLFDGAGRIERSLELSCVDDDEALLRAAGLGHPHDIIVRQEIRRVGGVRNGTVVPRGASVD